MRLPLPLPVLLPLVLWLCVASSIGAQGQPQPTPVLFPGSGVTFGYPGGVAVDTSYYVYVTNNLPQTILCGLKLTQAGRVETTYVASNPAFVSPTAIIVDPSQVAGAVFISDGHNNVVTKFDNSGYQISVFASSNNAISGPEAIAIDSTGALYVISHDFYLVVKFDPTGKQVAQFNFGNTSNSVDGVAVDGTGNIYVSISTRSFNYVILKLRSDGTMLTNFSTVNPALRQPRQLALDGVGALYVADQGNNRVVKLDATTGAQLGVYNLSNPALDVWSVAVDYLGNLYVTDLARNGVVVFQLTPPPQCNALYLNTSTPECPVPKNSATCREGQGWGVAVAVAGMLMAVAVIGWA